MTKQIDHRAEAVQWVGWAAEFHHEHDDAENARTCAAIAQVHATLALAEATQTIAEQGGGR